jgi:hypothetical protein
MLNEIKGLEKLTEHEVYLNGYRLIGQAEIANDNCKKEVPSIISTYKKYIKPILETKNDNHAKTIVNYFNNIEKIYQK